MTDAPICNHCARTLVEGLDGLTHEYEEEDRECQGPIPPVPMFSIHEQRADFRDVDVQKCCPTCERPW